MRDGLSAALNNTAMEKEAQRERDRYAHEEKMAAEARGRREAEEREAQRKRDKAATREK